MEDDVTDEEMELAFEQTFGLPSQEALEHHGVKGQKWGVRNDDAGGGSTPGKRELHQLDKFAEKNSGRIAEVSGVDTGENSHYERNRKLLIAGGIGLGIAAVAAGGYYAHKNGYLNTPGADNVADRFTSNFHTGLHNQLTKKLPPLDQLDDHDLTLPSSTIFKRVTGSANEALNDTHMYVSHLDEDVDRYVGVFSKAVKDRAGDAYLSEMTTHTSVSSPSLKKRVEIMRGMLGEVDRDPHSLTEGMSFKDVLIESTAAARAKALGADSDALERRLSSLSDDDLVRETYGTFVNTMGGQINNPQYRVSHASSYLDKVRSLGYNALVDDANTGVLAKSPLMLLTPKQSVKSRSSRKITDSDVKFARDRIELLNSDDALIRHARQQVLIKPATPQEVLAQVQRKEE